MAVLPAIAVAGGALGAVGNIIEGQEQADQARRQATESEIQAIESERRTRRKVEIEREEGKKFIGKQTSATAKAGVELKGTALLNLIQSQQNIEEDIAEIELGGKFEADAFRRQAEEQRRQARSAESSALFGAAGSLFGGFSQAVGGK